MKKTHKDALGSALTFVFLLWAIWVHVPMYVIIVLAIILGFMLGCLISDPCIEARDRIIALQNEQIERLRKRDKAVT